MGLLIGWRGSPNVGRPSRMGVGSVGGDRIHLRQDKGDKFIGIVGQDSGGGRDRLP